MLQSYTEYLDITYIIHNYDLFENWIFDVYC